jgi:hypothetical protein
MEQQVRRMLADPRSDALVSNFAGQWLQLRAIGVVAQRVLFPNFGENLRRDFRREADLSEHPEREPPASSFYITADYSS